ncbi:hypothetical protein K0M31_006443 [Melipona bicolor]|uniref:Uncharacterized protein n=1 Tax=Melipona bicolor TaxID=60889 RepID=A0AA40FTK1_9HYME|nr:hypothetical protein K0M31_006443 [Melipona bicolor]
MSAFTDASVKQESANCRRISDTNYSQYHTPVSHPHPQGSTFLDLDPENRNNCFGRGGSGSGTCSYLCLRRNNKMNSQTTETTKNVSVKEEPADRGYGEPIPVTNIPTSTAQDTRNSKKSMIC